MGKGKQIRIEMTAEVAGAVVESLERISQEIGGKIAELRLLLVGKGGGATAAGATGERKRRRPFSAATKKKMADAQRRRWAERKTG